MKKPVRPPQHLPLFLFSILFSFLWVQSQAAVSVIEQDQARAALLQGVQAIKVVGSPGRVALFDSPGAAAGQGAFAVTRDGEFDVALAAARWGSGRVVGFGHAGYLSFNSHAAEADTGTLFQNSVQWAVNSAEKNVGIVTDISAAATWLSAQGYTSVTLRTDWENALAAQTLVVTELGRSVSLAKRNALAAFVQDGGGLITGGVGWGYQQLGSDLKTMEGNLLLRQAGLAWADGFTTVNPIRPATELGNATAALAFAADVWAGNIVATEEQKKEAGRALVSALEILPDDEPLRGDINALFQTRSGVVQATPQSPVSDSLDQSVLAWEADMLVRTPVAEVVAHPTAQAVYGTIPAGADRSSRTVLVNTDKRRWLSTGMYAEPGEVVTITVPAQLLNQGYAIQLGGHVDNVSGRTEWRRIPFGIARSFPLDATTIQVASAFGGAIYLDVGTGSPPNLGAIGITMAGAIQAPMFVLGETTNAEWLGSLRNHPAPYAELVCDGVIFSVPSTWIRQRDDPEALMTFWNDVVARQDWVAAHEQLRENPERINLDVQISVGLLHAGYPQQGPTSYNNVVVDGNTLGVIMHLPTLQREGDWGWFHELGHEMQGRPDDSGNYYTFSGDVEVTVNIFANAAQEHRVPGVATAGWGYSNYPDEVMARAITTVQDPNAASFDAKDPYPFYYQLADGTDGWNTYREVMSVYTAEHAADRAANLSNQDRKDLWLERWSAVSSHNMVEYMVDHWGLEVSPAAIARVNALRTAGGQPLPGWMPLATSLVQVELQIDRAIDLPLGTAGLSLDGTAELVSVTAPSNGTLTNLGAGTYRYQPAAGFSGTDSFSTTYRSSAGNTQAFATTLQVNDGLSSAWAMNEGQGTTIADTGFSNALGSLQNGPSWVPGYSGSALDFDGVDDHVTIDAAAALEGTTDFTILAWIRTTATQTGMILQQRSGINGQYNFLMRSDGTLQFWMYNGGYQFDFSTTTTVNDGAWHQVVAQREGETGRIYIDGVLAGNAVGPVKALDPSLQVAIGFDARDQNKHFQGTIDDVRIYRSSIDPVYHYWISQFYPGVSDTATVGMQADPNADGQANLMAFFHGTDPTQPGPNPLRTTSPNGAFVLEYPRSDRAQHLAGTLMFATILKPANWIPLVPGANGATVETEDNGFGNDFGGLGIDRVTVRFPPNAPRIFSRIEIQPPPVVANRSAASVGKSLRSPKLSCDCVHPEFPASH